MLRRADLHRLEPLGKGGTARVYLVPGLAVPGIGAVVYKEYKESIRAKAGPALGPGLKSLVRFREQQSDRLREVWDARVVWPLHVVEDAGVVTGVLMRLIPDTYFQLVRPRFGPPGRKPREVDALFGSTDDMTRIGYAAVPVTTRLSLIAQIARTYAVMHRADIVIGDVSARNIVFDPHGPGAPVLVVDCDSARVKGNRSAFGKQPHTPHWEPPEALAGVTRLARLRRAGSTDSSALSKAENAATVQNKETDVYKLGLMVVRILDHGRGRAVNRDPDRAAGILSRRVGRPAADILQRSLAADPHARPTLRDWYDVFHGGAATPGAEPVRAAGPVAPSIPDGQVNGNWTFVDGKGWVRRPAGRA